MIDMNIHRQQNLASFPNALPQLLRISIGGSLVRATFGLMRRAATEMLEQGSFGFAGEQIPDAGLCKLFSKQ